MLMVATTPEFADPTGLKVDLVPQAQSHSPRLSLPWGDLTQSAERSEGTAHDYLSWHSPICVPIPSDHPPSGLLHPTSLL